jgi:hypothetical protein
VSRVSTMNLSPRSEYRPIGRPRDGGYDHGWAARWSDQ